MDDFTSAGRRRQPMQAVPHPSHLSERWSRRWAVLAVLGAGLAVARSAARWDRATAAARAPAVGRRPTEPDDARLPDPEFGKRKLEGRRLRRRRPDAELDPEGQGLRQPGARGRVRNPRPRTAVEASRATPTSAATASSTTTPRRADPRDAPQLATWYGPGPVRQPDRLRADAHPRRPWASPTRRCPAARRSSSATGAASSAPG